MKRFILTLWIIFLSDDVVCAQGQWYLGLYGARASDNRLLDILGMDYQFVDSYAAVISIGKPLWVYGTTLQLEAEGQVAQHGGLQTHQEVNAAFILRWLPFFWDHYLDTSFALGDGLSYASEKPILEQAGGKEETAKLLNYLLLEFAFVIPKQPSWDLFFRIHHRSGIYGLFGGVEEGSNMLGAGLRYRF